MQPKNLIQAQKDWRKNDSGDDEDSREEATFLLCALKGSEFLLPILEVKEVAEGVSITPYPLKSAGHLGVVNLRGNVVPVLSIGIEESAQKLKGNLDRLVILSTEKAHLFAIQVSTVRKITVTKSDVGESGTVNLDGRPVNLVRPDDVLKKWGIAC